MRAAHVVLQGVNMLSTVESFLRRANGLCTTCAGLNDRKDEINRRGVLQRRCSECARKRAVDAKARNAENHEFTLDLLTEAVRERFWTYVVKGVGDACWVWTGNVTYKGYGKFSVGGRNRFSHRVSYAMAFGVIPDKLVCHTCDNRACVRPEHFFLGDVNDNTQDMIQKGRSFLYTITLRKKKHGM